MAKEATPPRSKTAVDRGTVKHEQALPRRLGRVLSAQEFWDQMERWHVPDDVALELIEFPGKLGKSGKRPRFRFTTRQRRITSYLPEIDAALAAAGKDQAWLHRKIQAAPFSRRTPIEHMVATGMEDGLFALFPLLLLFTTILGYALRDNEKLRKDLINSALGNFPIIGPQLESHVHGLAGSASAVVIGSLLLVYGAIGLGLATQSAMNVVWNIPYVRWPSIYLRYLRALLVLVLLALSTIGLTVLTGFATLVSHGWIATGLLLVGSLALNFCLILVAFNVLTADALKWRDIALGAALATVFWQTLQLIGSWYVGRELQHSTNTYGFFGIVIVLLTWIYLGAQLFLLAAEINVVKHYRLWPRSMTQPPLTDADRLVFERLAQMEIRRPEVTLEVGYTSEADVDPLEATSGPEKTDHAG